MKKQHLINSLKIAINALKNDIIKYEWRDQDACNCGVVSQAVLNKSYQNLQKDTVPLFNVFRGSDIKPTWKNAVKHFCDITGKTKNKVLNDLFKAGLSPEDICHLEYLENPAILKRSGIMYTGSITETEIVKKEIKVKRWWGRTRTRIQEVKEIVTKQVTDYLEPEYYAKKENLIKYLVAWVQILEEEQKPVTNQSSATDLQEQLLKLVANEEYEAAALVRDQLATCI